MKYSSNDVVTPEPGVVSEPAVAVAAKSPESPKSQKKLLLVALLILIFFVLGLGVMYFLITSGALDSVRGKVTDSDKNEEEESDEPVEEEEPEGKVGEEGNIIELSKIYDNDNYPKLVIKYPNDWELSTKNIDRTEESFDDLQVIFTKSEVDLVFELKPVAGIGAMPTCYTYDEIDYTHLDANWSRVSKATDVNTNRIVYHKGVLDRAKSTSDFESEFDGYSQIEPSAAGKMDEYEACATLINVASGTPSTYKTEDGYELGALMSIWLEPRAKVTAELAKEADAIVLGIKHQ